MQTPPHDLRAEEALIGAALLSHKAIIDAEDLDPADFYRPAHQHIWNSILRLYKTGRVDPVLVAADLASEGHTGPDYGTTALATLTVDTPTVSNAPKYVQIIRSAARRRAIIQQLAHASQIAYSVTDPEQAIDAITPLLSPSANTGDLTPDPTFIDHVAQHPANYRWLIPDFLERGDRMLVTAGEGSGKSVLLAQIGFMAAAGLHPWTGHPIDPVNVAIIDLENSPRLISRRLAWLRTSLANTGNMIHDGRLRIAHRTEGIDLTKRRDQLWLRNRCLANQTELLIIGPIYRMMSGTTARGDVGGEDQARHVTAALDTIRTDLDVTLAIETHAPHAHQFGRDLRPFGSSVWLRWPEFGIGLRKEAESVYELEHWRGPRDQRTWPTTLQRGVGKWPWTAIMPTKGH